MADRPQQVVIVGGGLAGMAAAIALAERGVATTLLEAKRRLGGRAASFEDPQTGVTVDHCQHVAMGCCTQFLHFCRTTGIDAYFLRDTTLHFVCPRGTHHSFKASGWLPAPLHLAPALRGLGYLTASDRRSIERALLALARSAERQEETILTWLRAQRQSSAAIDGFWSVVLVSALGETLERASLAAARKVFVDGFMSRQEAHHILVPTRPLGELYEEQISPWLKQHGVQVRLQSPVKQILTKDGRIVGVRLASGETLSTEHVIVATHWRAAARLVDGVVDRELLERVNHIKSSPITAVHLWFDRAIMPFPHAVLVGRLSQWVFSGGDHYYQVVISGSRELIGRPSDVVVDEVLADLRTAFPESHDAVLRTARVVTQPEAVFSPTPESEKLRPAQETNVPGLSLAGDWTASGWPATMESAVRSGYLAAEAALRALGRPDRCLIAEPPRAWLTRLLVR